MWGDEIYSSSILNLGNRRRGVFGLMPLTLELQENSYWVSLCMRLSVALRRSGEKSHGPSGIRTPTPRPVSSQPSLYID
jgi:hypothetical protein